MIVRSKKFLGRRQLLRGLLAGSSVGLALPLLDAMLNSHGDALATGQALPKRLGVWFWGCGVRPERFFPKATGPNWEITEELAPLEHLRSEISIVSGMNIKSQGAAHFRGRSGMLCGAHSDSSAVEPSFGTVGGPSLDQIAADAWHGQTKHHSLVTGVSIVGGNHTKEGVGTTSWRGPDEVVPTMLDPRELHDFLFESGDLPNDTQAALNAARISMLDPVKEDLLNLKKQLGSRDIERLEAHLEGVRELERKLADFDATCQATQVPDIGTEDPARELLEEKNDLISEMMTMALVCDLSRAFTIQFAQMQMNTLFWQIGATEGMHIMTHDDRGTSDPLDPQPEKVHKAVVFIMQRFANFLEKLHAAPEGDGTVLDHCIIMGTSDVHEGTSHSVDNMPIILAGSAAGQLRKGIHLNGGGRNTSDLLLTLLHGVGVMEPSIGKDGGYSDRPVTELFA